MVSTVIFVLIAKWMCVQSLIMDTEWLGGYVTEVQYYQPWDERVSCRHPIYCSRTVCSGSGKSRSCHSESYVCGHVHPYDVDYHPEHWECVTTLMDYGISQYRYNELVAQFGTGKQFVDLHRNYHSIDGDMYSTKWGGQDETLEPVADSESYENRPQASHTIFHYNELDTSEIKQYKPFNYPPIVEHKQITLLGYSDPDALQKLQVLNSRLGHSKQVRVYVLVFQDQPREAGLVQERYWQGGNMNEIVVCVGIDSEKRIQWGHTFSWTESTGVKIKIRHEIEDEEFMNLSKIVDTIQDEVKFEWKRKDFHDFDYINIDPTINQIIVIFILTMLVNIGIAWWIIVNEFHDDPDFDSDSYAVYGTQKKKRKRW
jgi:hypothetical protein